VAGDIVSNLLLLPQLAMTVTIVNNAGWYDTFVVPSPSGVPLDLTGLSFQSELRLTAIDPNIKLTASTAAGTMTGGDATGIVGWAIPFATMKNLAAGSYVLDIVGTEISSGNMKSLFETGPAIVTILQGVTR
jgi:hypothetical protein